MNCTKLFPSKWLRAVDAEDSDLVLTIKEVREELVGDDGNKPVVYFADHELGLVLNKTNMNTIAKLYGFETDDWEGKRITLFSTQVEFKGEQVDALRVRNKPPKPRAPQPAAAIAGPTTNDDDPPF